MPDDLQSQLAERSDYRTSEDRLLSAYRIPVVATLLFIFTMAAIVALSLRVIETYGLTGGLF